MKQRNVLSRTQSEGRDGGLRLEAHRVRADLLPPGEAPTSGATLETLLQRWQSGDRDEADGLWPILYRELEGLASSLLRHSGGRTTLEVGELLNESCLRLLRRPNLTWPSSGHFFAFAAQVMRRILLDQTRRRRAAKRQAERSEPPPESIADPRTDHASGALDIDQLLTRLKEISPRAGRLVELRFFTGLPVDQAATVLRISKATAIREWQAARAWLYDQLQSRSTAATRESLPAVTATFLVDRRPGDGDER
jgi:RNA polymerase sigma factor (TIGR02999 family)